MATTTLAQGARNIKSPGGSGGFANYGGVAALGDGVTDDTQAFLDAFNINRSMASGLHQANDIFVYVPSGTYRLTRFLIMWSKFFLIGEPSAPPTVFLDTGSITLGNTPATSRGLQPAFIIIRNSFSHNAYDVNWDSDGGVDPGPSSPNNTFETFIRDINFTVKSGNTGCAAVMDWNIAQCTSLRNVTLNGTGLGTTIPGGQTATFRSWPGVDGEAGGGSTLQNLTFTGYPIATIQNTVFERFWRGCTFNGSVIIEGGTNVANYIACTFNNPGGAGLASNTGQYVLSLDDCVFTANSSFTNSGGATYHLENCTFTTANSNPAFAAGTVVQSTSGNVFFNGVSESGNSANLAVPGVVKGSPYPNPAFPQPTAACVSVAAFGNNIASALAASNEVYLPPGTYTPTATLVIGSGKKLWGCGQNQSVIQSSFNPVVSVTGRGSGSGITMAGIRIQQAAASGNCMLWNGDASGSLLVDCDFGNTNTTSTALVNFQTGGVVVCNCCPALHNSNTCVTFANISTTDGLFLYCVDPQHYTGTTYNIVNANGVYFRQCTFEVLSNYTGSVLISVSGSSNLNFAGVIYALRGGPAPPRCIQLTSSKASLWNQASNGTLSPPFTGLIEDGSTFFGSANSSWPPFPGYVTPSSVANSSPSVSATGATVGLNSATLNGVINSANGQPITSDGFHWGPENSPQTYPNTATATTVQAGSFSSALISGLTTNSRYHYTAFGINSIGTGTSGDSLFIPAPPPPFVQGFSGTSNTNGTAVTSITAAFPSQTAGHTNVVAVSFHSSTVSMASTLPVTDTVGNVYIVASSLTVSDLDSQVIYYCHSILGSPGQNTVTANFASAVPFVSLRVAEYQGLGGIDVQSSGSSTVAGATASVSPAITTSNASDTVIVAVTCGAGLNGTVTGFLERVSGSPFGSDLQDDSPGTVLSSFSAPSPIVSSTWVENLVAFAPSGIGTIPALAVSTATGIGTTTATLNGSITSNGSQSITADGFDWGTTISYGTHINVTPPVQSGSFLSNLTGLSPGTTYHYRSTAQNASGTGVSGDQQFSTTSVGTTYALVNHAYVNPNSVTGSTLTLVPTWTQTVGDILIVAIGYTSGSATVTVSDTANGAYSAAIGPTVDTPGGQTQYVFYRSNIAAANSGTNTITCTFSASALLFPDMRVSEFSSTLGTTWSVNQSVGLAASSATTDTSGNMPATTVSNALIYGAGYTSNSFSTAGPGFTAIDITLTDFNLHEYQVVTSVGSYAATGNDGAGGTVVMQAVAFVASSSVVTSVPTLIQHASTGSNSNAPDPGTGGTGNAGSPFHFNLPNPSLNGNTLILEATGRSVTAPTITDNIETNTWTLVKSVNDGAAQTTVFVALNAAVGTQQLVITFSSNVFNAHFSCSEFNNITSVVGSSALHNASTATISSGLLTGGIQGDLIWMCGYDTQNANGLSSNLTNVASGSGLQLLSVDLFVGTFSQYGIQPTATNLTPTATLTSSTDAFNAVSVVLRSGSVGTALPSGIRILRVQSSTCNRNINVQFPSSGNLIYAQTGFSTGLANLGYPTGWTKISVGGGQGAYISNANTPNLNFLISGTTTGITTLCTIVFYDITGAAASPFDLTTNASSGFNFTGPQANIVCGTISPTTPNGLCIFSVPINAGIVSGATPHIPACMNDMCWYGNEAFGPDLMSNADGYGHIYNVSSGSTSFTWGTLEVNSGQADSLQYLSVAFKAGTTDITAPSIPTGFSASTASNSSISVNWTVPVANVDPDNTNLQIIYPVEHMGGEFPSFTQFGIGPGVVSGADSLLDSGLLHPGTQYSYQMRARDPVGNTSGYTAIFFGSTSASDVTKPTVPGIPVLVSETNNSITIAWATSTDTQESSVSLTYTLQRSINGGTFTQIATNIPGVASGNITYSDAVLTALNQYTYQVQSVNPANLSGSNSSNFSTASATITTEPNPPFFVQGNTSSASAVTSATCAFLSAQTTGDGNLVVISTSSAAAINISGPVTDQSGHTYTLIGGPTSAGSAPVLTQWIYFSNI